MKIHLLIFCACEMSHLSESMTPFSWCEIQVDKITATRDAYSFMGFYSVSYRNSFFSNESRELIGSTSQCELCIDHEWFVIKFFDKQIDLNSLFYVFFSKKVSEKTQKALSCIAHLLSTRMGQIMWEPDQGVGRWHLAKVYEEWESASIPVV